MPSLNRVQLIGRLGKDPDERHTNKGKKYCTFSVAVGRRWKDKEGELHEETDWFNVEAWGKLAEICVSYLEKGKLVFLEGALRTRRYEQEGVTRYFTTVILRNMQMLDRKKPDPIIEESEEESQE